jgi:type I restriction enzyme M protein
LVGSRLSEREGHFWSIAEILRGPVDPRDHQHSVFALLSYKRLCDVWEEEYEARFAEHQDEVFARAPGNHHFHIPEGCFWADVRRLSANLGTALNVNLRAIENRNPRLKDVFQDVDFANTDRFPDPLLKLL